MGDCKKKKGELYMPNVNSAGQQIALDLHVTTLKI